MPISNIPILAMLRTKMHWHQERQRVLSENVANADTPQFRPRDLAPPSFEARQAGPALAGVMLARTDPLHIAGAATDGASGFQAQRRGGYEVRPTGNAVTLEDEMLKVAANQLDYQTVTSLYGRSLSMIKTALGKR
jgi:flagellar basal-body rod protein FlgB